MALSSSTSRIAFQLYGRAPVALLRRLARTRLLIPYYHIVGDGESPHVKHLYAYKTIRQFEDDLDFLCWHYEPVGMHEVLSCIKEGRPLPQRAFLLTFDDGYRESSDVVAPILQRKGITATFFVNNAFIDNQDLCYLNKASLLIDEYRRRPSRTLTDAVSRLLHLESDDVASGILSVDYRRRHLLDRIAELMDVDFAHYASMQRPYLSTSQIRALLDMGFTIGAHSIDHPRYASLSFDEQVHQTLASVNNVRQLFGLDYGVFAFPHSDANVSRAFFSRLALSPSVDLTFGTAGLIDDHVPNHLQRFSLERPVDTARSIIAYQHARRLKRLMTMNSEMVR